MKAWISLMAGVALTASLPWGSASAGWYYGTIENLSVGYEGTSVSFKVDGWVRGDCTCYATWASHMCLDSTRDEFELEQALLLTAIVADLTMGVRIDEVTCRVTAMRTTQ